MAAPLMSKICSRVGLTGRSNHVTNLHLFWLLMSLIWLVKAGREIWPNLNCLPKLPDTEHNCQQLSFLLHIFKPLLPIYIFLNKLNANAANKWTLLPPYWCCLMHYCACSCCGCYSVCCRHFCPVLLYIYCPMSAPNDPVHTHTPGCTSILGQKSWFCEVSPLTVHTFE